MPAPIDELHDGSIGVITVSKDDPAGLGRTVASIACQSMVPHELALVRVGRSREVSVDAAWAGHVIEVADSGQGISAAFNAAIASCSSEWLLFLNGGDTLLHRDSLARLVAECTAASAAEDADIVACRARTDAGTALPRRPPSSMCSHLYISHQASAFRRSLFLSIGPYTEDFRIRMDLDWMARYLLRHGHRRVRFVDDAIVEYRLDGISSTSLVDFHLEELRVLLRSPRFMPALLDFALRRFPGRLAQAGARRLVRGGATRAAPHRRPTKG